MKLEYINEKGEGIIFSTLRPFILQRIEGFGAIKNSISMISNPYQNGSTVTSRRLESRELVIEGTILGSTRQELAEYRRSMIKVLNPNLKGKLIYSYGEVEKKIDVEIEFAPVFSNQGLNQQFMINMIAPCPFWDDVKEVRKDIALWVANFEYPLDTFPIDGIEIEYRMPSLIAQVDNDGDVSCGMVIEFRASGPVDNPSIINLNTRKFYKLEGRINEGDIITIDTRYGKKKVNKIVDGVITNIFNMTAYGSDFLQLELGTNSFRYDADVNIDNLEMSIYYTPQYLGV